MLVEIHLLYFILVYYGNRTICYILQAIQGNKSLNTVELQSFRLIDSKLL